MLFVIVIRLEQTITFFLRLHVLCIVGVSSQPPQSKCSENDYPAQPDTLLRPAPEAADGLARRSPIVTLSASRAGSLPRGYVWLQRNGTSPHTAPLTMMLLDDRFGDKPTSEGCRFQWILPVTGPLRPRLLFP